MFYHQACICPAFNGDSWTSGVPLAGDLGEAFVLVIFGFDLDLDPPLFGNFSMVLMNGDLV